MVFLGGILMDQAIYNENKIMYTEKDGLKFVVWSFIVFFIGMIIGTIL